MCAIGELGRASAFVVMFIASLVTITAIADPTNRGSNEENQTQQHPQTEFSAPTAETHSSNGAKSNPKVDIQSGQLGSTNRQPSEQELTRELSQEERSTRAQETMARANWWIVGLQFGTLALVLCTLIVTRSTLKTTRDTLESTNNSLVAAQDQTRILQNSQTIQFRPWFDIAGFEATPMTQSMPNQIIRLRCELTLKNIGHTPLSNIIFLERPLEVSTQLFQEAKSMGDHPMKKSFLRVQTGTRLESSPDARVESVFEASLLSPLQTRTFVFELIIYEPLDEAKIYDTYGTVYDNIRADSGVFFIAELMIEYSDLASEIQGPEARHVCFVKTEGEVKQDKLDGIARITGYKDASS